jgi:hypothetical protein
MTADPNQPPAETPATIAKAILEFPMAGGTFAQFLQTELVSSGIHWEARAIKLPHVRNMSAPPISFKGTAALQLLLERIGQENGLKPTANEMHNAQRILSQLGNREETMGNESAQALRQGETAGIAKFAFESGTDTHESLSRIQALFEKLSASLDISLDKGKGPGGRGGRG